MLDTQIEPKPAHSLDSISLMPSNIKFANQSPSEHVVLLIRAHRIILMGHFIRFLIDLLIPIILFILLGWLHTISIFRNINVEIKSIYIISIVLLWYLWSFTGLFADFLNWFYNAYIVTSERLIDLDFLGVLNHSIKELDLKNIEDATDTHIGILQTVFDMGRVVISTASERTTFSLDNVPRSSQVRDFIMDLSIYNGGRK